MTFTVTLTSKIGTLLNIDIIVIYYIKMNHIWLPTKYW